MKAKLILLASFAVLSASPAKSANLEAVRARAAAFEAAVPPLPPSDDDEAQRSLRMAQRASDRAYRLVVDLGMMSRTAAEAKAELAALRTDPARKDKVEYLLKFLVDAYPVQGDGAAFILDKVLWLKYQAGKPAAPGYGEAVAALVERVRASDDATKALRAAVDELKAGVGAPAGERSVWLAGRLAEMAQQQETYSAYLRGKTDILAKPAS